MLSSSWKLEKRRTEGDLYVEIPSCCRLGDLAFLATWLTCWAVFGVVLGFGYLAQYSRSPWLLAVLGAMALWGAALALSAWKLAYWLAGSERLRVSAEGLTIERGVPRLRSRRIIPAREISECRVSPRRYWIRDWHWPRRMGIPKPGWGSITVVHQRKAVRFGRNLDAADAEELAREIAECVGCPPNARAGG